MKHQILVAAMLAVCVGASAQGIEKRVPVTKNTQLEYTVANDGRTKDGAYAVKSTANTNAVLVQGNYKDNSRAGTWYFFDGKGKLTMRYSYDQKKLLYLDKTILENVKVDVISEDKDVAVNASVPLPLCPVDYYVTLIGSEINANYKDPAMDGLTAEITAHVDAQGKASYTVAYQISKDKRSTPKVVELKSAFPIEWVPSSYNSKTVPSEFTVFAKIQSNTVADDTYKRFRWND